ARGSNPSRKYPRNFFFTGSCKGIQFSRTSHWITILSGDGIRSAGILASYWITILSGDGIRSAEIRPYDYSSGLLNDSNPGGRIHGFWAGIFADEKAEFKKKVVDAKSDKCLIMNKRSLDVLKETVVEHNEASVILADLARDGQDVRKRRKQYHQLDGSPMIYPSKGKIHSLRRRKIS
ncbi:9471_t:CDS:2, partial [Paraglomus occultum]